MEPLTIEQQNMLVTWSTQRDEMLASIAAHRAEHEELLKKNVELANSNSELIERSQKLQGFIEAIEVEESKRKNLICSNLVELEKRKTELESQIPLLEKQIEILTKAKDVIGEQIPNLAYAHERVVTQSKGLEEFVKNIGRINQKNLDDTNTLISTIKGLLSDLIKKK